MFSLKMLESRPASKSQSRIFFYVSSFSENISSTLQIKCSLIWAGEREFTLFIFIGHVIYSTKNFEHFLEIQNKTIKIKPKCVKQQQKNLCR